jgi:hypothetical protein
MWWRKRKAYRAAHSDYGRHRLSDGDTVPVPGFRTYREILAEPTRELPTVQRPLFTPGQEQRAGIRNWLAS